MAYVDGYVLVVPKKKVADYRRMASKAGKVWREHGALEFRECVGDDIDIKGFPLTFRKLMKLKPSETVFFSWVVFKSRKDRDRVNARVIKDPRMASMMDPKDMPVDPKRMAFGGFKPLVDL
jgi:uncharacterized protein YbaA (DUF1428 family)